MKDAAGGVGELSKRVVSGEYHSILFGMHSSIELELLSSGLFFSFGLLTNVGMCVYIWYALLYTLITATLAS